MMIFKGVFGLYFFPNFCNFRVFCWGGGGGSGPSGGFPGCPEGVPGCSGSSGVFQGVPGLFRVS